MSFYNDEDFQQRKLFVGNIPYLRDLGNDIIREITYLMRE